MIDYESSAALLMLIKHYDPEYKHDNFQVLSTDLDSEWRILESFSDIHAWVELGDDLYVKVEKLVNGFTVMYCKA